MIGVVGKGLIQSDIRVAGAGTEVGWGRVECYGVGRRGLGWTGLSWDGLSWDKLIWDGIEFGWIELRWDGMGRDE